jgi:hypothetical protein
MECSCPVCQALAGLTEADLSMDVAAQLPEDVQAILAAQSRLHRHRPREGDARLVQEAARRCRAGRFRSPGPTH